MTAEEYTRKAIFQHALLEELGVKIREMQNTIVTSKLTFPIPIYICESDKYLFSIKYLKKEYYVKGTIKRANEVRTKNDYLIIIEFIECKEIKKANGDIIEIEETMGSPIYMNYLGNMADDARFTKTILNDFNNEIRERIIEIIVDKYIEILT